MVSYWRAVKSWRTVKAYEFSCVEPALVWVTTKSESSQMSNMAEGNASEITVYEDQLPDILPFSESLEKLLPFRWAATLEDYGQNALFKSRKMRSRKIWLIAHRECVVREAVRCDCIAWHVSHRIDGWDHLKSSFYLFLRKTERNSGYHIQDWTEVWTTT